MEQHKYLDKEGFKTFLTGLRKGCVFGKGLSKNDYTDEEKAQLAEAVTAVEELADTVAAINSSYAKVWKGTQEEYDAIATKDDNTVYLIVEAE